jgi:hypothetical protein
VTAAQQASDLGSIVRELLAASDVPVVIIQSLEDQSVGTDDAYNGVNAGFGVLTAAGAPKPAGCTISALIGGSLSC